MSFILHFYSIAGGFDDNVFGEEGMDFVFGDHGEFYLDEDISHKLIYATSIDASCTPGADNIMLGSLVDTAIGGGG